jgi:hypothetical protein
MQWRCRSDGDAVVWRSDPHFFFTYSPEQLATYAQRLSCHLLVVHGKQSHRVSRDAAQVRGPNWVASPGSSQLAHLRL